MNVFGAFRFGGLIKTFLPGLLFVALLLWLLDFLTPSIIPKSFQDFVFQLSVQFTITLTIVSAIFLGVLSNIICFMFLNDLVIRKPVNQKNPKLWQIYDNINSEILYFQSEKNCKSICPNLRIRDYLDAEFSVMFTAEPGTLIYIREQYWNWMEFQLNMAFVCLLFMVVTLLPLLGLKSMITDNTSFVLIFIVLSGLIAMFVSSGRKNYKRHLSKMASFLVGALCALKSEQSSSP